MSGRALVMCALAGCGFEHGVVPGTGDGGPDVHVIDAPPECSQWSAKHFTPCAIPAPLGDLTLDAAHSPYTYTTTNGELTDNANTVIPLATITLPQTDGVTAILVAVNGLTIDSGAELDVIGDKSFVVAAWGSMAIAGTIDAGSYRSPARTGAGGGAPLLCVDAAAAQPGVDEADTGGGSGGGGGGGFRGAGGMGGPGDTGGQNAGGAGGGAVSFPMIVRGGCSGAASGKAGPDPAVTSPSDANTTAPGGAGGGALQLTARMGIFVSATGRLLAGGAGGEGSPLNSAVGGGGGGAGGYIGLDSATLTIASGAVLAANGGGGGASSGFAFTGHVGADGQPGTMAAAGGAAQSCANAGGNGSSVSAMTGVSAAQTAQSCGGGGGGGGAGFIGVFSSATFSTSATSSPPLQLNPF
jgi:hypothetical protein